jgi:hypothetical protein
MRREGRRFKNIVKIACTSRGGKRFAKVSQRFIVVKHIFLLGKTERVPALGTSFCTPPQFQHLVAGKFF